MQADFELSVSQLLQRGDFGEERYEKIDFQIKVREKFMKLKAEDDGRLPWFTLDARKSIEELRMEISLIADKVVGESKHKSLSRLW